MGGGGTGNRGEIGDHDEVSEAQRRARIQKIEEKTKLFLQKVQNGEQSTEYDWKVNTIAFTKAAGRDHFQTSEVAKLLKDMGFNPSEIDGVMINCYRPNQIEVTFNDKCKVKVSDLTKKIEEIRLPYSVANFAFYEESLIVYGLPFGNISQIKKELKKSVEDFVSRVIDKSPCYDHKKDQFGFF